MASLISFPMRLLGSGAIATVEEGTDEIYAEQLAVLAMTDIGSRVFVPEFGIPEPTFTSLDQVALQNGVALFGPPVLIDSIVARQQGTTLAYDIAFSVDLDAAEGESFVEAFDEDLENQ